MIETVVAADRPGARQACELIRTAGILLAEGDYQRAADAYRKATQILPDIAEAHYNLAIALNRLGNQREALAEYRMALQIRPDFVHAHYNMANIFKRQGQYHRAIIGYRRVVELQPDHYQAHYQLAECLKQTGRYEQAVPHAQRALEAPDAPAVVYATLADCLIRTGRLQEAADVLRQAAERFPGLADSYANLGGVLNLLGDYDQAWKLYHKALAINPDHTLAHWNRGLLLLVRGDLEAGWKDYAYRKRSKDLWKTSYPNAQAIKQPLWDGQPFEGKTLLVHYEQGIGDTIQFARYLPMVKARGGKVIMEINPSLFGLFEKLGCIDQLVPSGRLDDVKFDMHVFLLDLPGIFNTTLQTIPAQVPYLRPDDRSKELWASRLAGVGLKVGLVWAGSPKHAGDRFRSCRLEQLRPLFRTKNIRFFSLQKGPARNQLKACPDLPILDLDRFLTNWSQTAAIVANLDLLISVDTSVLHLAGAMARPAWGLIAAVPDWRWLLDRTDSPWYPSLRLFRQGQDRSWGPVIERVAMELQDLVSRSS